MTIRSHPSEAILLAYAAGTLAPGASLVVSAHLSFCNNKELEEFPRIPVEEHVIACIENAKLVLDQGFWAGMTLYPDTKCTPQRAADIFEMYGTERLWINSAGDWGHSDPLAVPKCRLEMQQRGHSAETIAKLSYDNPQRFLSQCTKFTI